MNYFKNLTTVMLTAVGLIFGMAGVANAVEVPVEERAYVYDVHTIGDETTYGQMMLSLNKTLPEGSTGTINLTDCHGNPVGANTHKVTDFGFVIINNVKTGSIVNWSFSLTHPGLDPYTLSGVYNPRNAACGNDVVKNPCEDLAVQKWSTKRSGFSKAKVGRTLRVTKTRADDCRVTYIWSVGGHVTKSVLAPSFKVRKHYRGGAVKVTIQVTNGFGAVSKTLRFGRVKK